MAANPDFKKIVVHDVTFNWPRLDQPYRYDHIAGRTEPCAASAQGAGWSLAWLMSHEDAKKLHADLKAHYADCQTRNSKLPEFSAVFGMKKLDDGQVQFTARKRAMSDDGKEKPAPRVVGPDLKDFPDKAIWSGSTGTIRVLAFPSTNPQDRSGGISLLLDAVQIKHAEYGGDSLEDDFGPAQDVDPFGDSPAPAQAADDEF